MQLFKWPVFWLCAAFIAALILFGGSNRQDAGNRLAVAPAPEAGRVPAPAGPYGSQVRDDTPLPRGEARYPHPDASWNAFNGFPGGDSDWVFQGGFGPPPGMEAGRPFAGPLPITVFSRPQTPLGQVALPRPLPAAPRGTSGETVAGQTGPADASTEGPETPEAQKVAGGRGVGLSLARLLPFRSDTGDFIFRRIGPGDGNTLMIVGGIQGDEPGAFTAAALIASHYTIRKGAVWVVPNLNMPSILTRKRGVSGDMNRKFAAISPDDPDYEPVMKVKSLLLDERVDMILNLHDGSGFYRPVWENRQCNPRRWGQSLIIDQENMSSPPCNLLAIAKTVGGEVNGHLLDPKHRYHINNTLTAEGNEEMAKTLSFFAVCNGKPAFGVEASKDMGTEYRTYYHLRVIEAFMRYLDIEFERDFELTPEGVLAAVNSGLAVGVYGNRIVLPLENVRPNLNFLPFRKNSRPDVRTSKPLLALVPDKGRNGWRVAYGNRTLTRMKPQFMDFDDSLDSLEMELDGRLFRVGLGEIVSVRDSFLVKDIPDYRVNAIGARKEKNGTEAGVVLERRDFSPRFSVDREGSLFRVEVYRENAFVGMVLVRFADETANGERPLTATGGPESSLGF